MSKSQGEGGGKCTIVLRMPSLFGWTFCPALCLRSYLPTVPELAGLSRKMRCRPGCMDSVEWNGGMEWTGLDWTGMEWNNQMICGRDRPLTL